MPNRPNLLVIMSDQHNPHVLSCCGDPLVRTPHLDALTNRGVLFENAYCPSPLCVPSRMSFMTSRHPTDNQAWTNQCELASDIPTFAHALGAAGYEVVLGGRMHFVGPDQRHGFERRLIGDLGATYQGGRRPKLGHITLASAGQSRISVEIAGPGRTAYQAYDDTVARACCELLQAHADGPQDRPLCLVAGFVLPHCPFIAPKPLYDYYYDRIELPTVPEGYFERLHPAVAQWRRNRGIEDLTDEEIRRARAAYYGIVELFDGTVGRLLSALDESGLAKDTVVVYTSDHGEMAGDKGMWWKSNFYDGSVGVPLIVSWPGRFPRGDRRAEVVSIMDIGPTLIELAGGESPPDTAGESLVPLIRGDGAIGWRDEALAELCGMGGEPYARMIRRGPWKLTHYEGHRPQLFNLMEDPHEFDDRGEDPACADIREELHARVLQAWSPEDTRRVLARRARDRKALVEWFNAVRPDEPDHWEEPDGCNVFPEE